MLGVLIIHNCGGREDGAWGKGAWRRGGFCEVCLNAGMALWRKIK